MTIVILVILAVVAVYTALHILEHHFDNKALVAEQARKDGNAAYWAERGYRN